MADELMRLESLNRNHSYYGLNSYHIIMRFSKQKETVYQVLIDTHSHPTANWVFEKAKSILPNISLGTVYRNLGQLESDGNIRSFALKGIVRYDGNLDQHSHFLCENCDLMIDIHPKNIQRKYNNIIPKNFTANSIDLTITGFCNSCKST
ncbi:MAG: transcriptional repressor [Candidatus Marinimicrobia bacterium]|nr:transcriptional repressor [Candidatus Neomarinimicrobiota bacterium]MBT3500786.1 transcriptional repressor [Candidatus Neomarinimicrobiota bacterium]MBT3839963.1 transcriptional repressor [Candidatus Neomarinimicrobiota bacterium]MBT3998316.1 transcriptional repressor [Candidatus Neomarinimicrobiota bacterium]MBT4282394.1 transcriptional repressor [Candidatus Neomarinimicrobiota bacterium]